MKVSELIEILEKYKADEGDLDIVVEYKECIDNDDGSADFWHEYDVPVIYTSNINKKHFVIGH